MRRIVLGIVFLGLSLYFSGCAFTQANLHVAYDETKATKGLLSSVQALRVNVGEFTDKRPERDKIGYKRNAYGMKTADILTTKPVPQIVREAFVAELTKNNHLVSAENRDVIFSGEITTFWFDYQINFWTVDFMGTVSVNFNVSDGKTGAKLLGRTYQGHYNEKSMGGLDSTWERVMNTALERMMEEMSTDPKLLEALHTFRGT